MRREKTQDIRPVRLCMAAATCSALDGGILFGEVEKVEIIPSFFLAL